MHSEIYETSKSSYVRDQCYHVYDKLFNSQNHTLSLGTTLIVNCNILWPYVFTTHFDFFSKNILPDKTY